MFDARVVERDGGPNRKDRRHDHRHPPSPRRVPQHGGAEQAKPGGKDEGDPLIGAQDARGDAEDMLHHQGEAENGQAQDGDRQADAQIRGV